MNKKTKREDKKAEKLPKTPQKDKTDSLLNDQKERGYYYDDAYGYEVYDDENDDENDDDSD